MGHYQSRQEGVKQMAKYSSEFKEEAMRLSDETRVRKVSKQPEIAYYKLADWRNHSKNKGSATVSNEMKIRIRNR